VVQRRVSLMVSEGIEFQTGVCIGRDISVSVWSVSRGISVCGLSLCVVSVCVVYLCVWSVCL